jgi:hypothetical protein
MKQKDIALIIVVIFISGVTSLLLSRTLISSPKNRSQKVEVVEPIVADFPAPPEKYFNSEAFDPTQLIKIGNDTNPKPFNASN